MTGLADNFRALRVLPARAKAMFATMRSLRAAERESGPVDAALLAIREQAAVVESRLGDLQARELAAQQSSDGIAADVAALRAEVAARSVAADQSTADFGARIEATADLAHQRDLATRQALLAALWLTNAPISQSPLISVVMPTYLPERLGHLRHAIDSVLAQSYHNWELLVVDNSRDGMLDEPPAWWPQDTRVHVRRSAPHQGNAARNEGLAAAQGQLIAYLDDDCVWFPWWLRAALTSLEGSPSAKFVYGVRLNGAPGAAPDSINALPLTPLQLHIDNPIDTNCFVHRAEVDERWDTGMQSCGDYDLVERIAHLPHEFIPVPAVAYGTSAPSRIWSPEKRHLNSDDVEAVRAHARRRRPLRIVAANTLYPLITETYIGDEVEGLRRHGVDIVLARYQRGPTECSSVVDAPIFESLEAAISAHDPDLVLSHWAETALWSGPIAAAHGVPHATRLHSFCASAPDESVYNEWCVGSWGFACNPRQHPLARVLPTQILDPAPPHTDDSARTRTLLSVSAGLPKKAWPTLIEAAAGVPDARLRIIMGRTAGWEHLANEVAELSDRHGHTNAVDVDVPFAHGQAAIRSSAALVYCVAPGVHLGEPRSVIEGALAATPLVLPDAPEMRAMVGETASFYQPGNAASMAAAMRRAIDTPHDMDQRVQLADRIRSVHADPTRSARWTQELTLATVAWQSTRTPGPAAAAGRWWVTR